MTENNLAAQKAARRAIKGVGPDTDIAGNPLTEEQKATRREVEARWAKEDAARANAARLLDGVRRINPYNSETSALLYEDEVLAALSAALPDLTDPVTVHANMLRGTIAKPTVEQIVHMYGREAFQPMIDAAVAKALEDACLAVSEHADWPEDERGRTDQVGLFSQVINAILAITPARAPHVNETPKSEHDGADVLNALPADVAGVVEDAGKVVGQLQTICACNIDSTPCMSEDDCRYAIAASNTIRALIALATAQAAQIAGLEDKLAFVQRREIASNTKFDERWSEAQTALAAMTKERDELISQHAVMMMERDAAQYERGDLYHALAAERAKVARIAKAWPLVRDTDCTGGELASAIDEIDAALSEAEARDD